MDKANAAEWLLRRVVDPARASELVGDQLEARPTAGRFNFWISIARLLFVFSWHTILGMVISPAVGLSLALISFLFANTQSGGTQGFPKTIVFHVRIYLLGVSALLWAAAVFSLVRFGWRGALTSAGFITSILWSLSLCFFSRPAPAVTLAVLWVSFVIFCARSAKWRRALGILFCAVVAAWLTAFALSIFPRDPYSVFGKWQGLMALFLVPIVESGVTTSLHRKFIASSNSVR
jgi:hypothetical protein